MTVTKGINLSAVSKATTAASIFPLKPYCTIAQFCHYKARPYHKATTAASIFPLKPYCTTLHSSSYVTVITRQGRIICFQGYSSTLPPNSTTPLTYHLISWCGYTGIYHLDLLVPTLAKSSYIHSHFRGMGRKPYQTIRHPICSYHCKLDWETEEKEAHN